MSMQPRYSALHQTLHWITALCMLAILPLAWVATNAKEKTPGLETMFDWHKTLGIIVLLITGFRLVWRFMDKPPAYPPKITRLDKAVAHVTYALFYVALLWMPITGLIMSSFEPYKLHLFGFIPLASPFKPNEAMADRFGYYHALGQWLIYALILLHLTATAFHVIWGRDGVLGRMLPAQALEPGDG
jgi:cytochrome b561